MDSSYPISREQRVIGSLFFLLSLAPGSVQLGFMFGGSGNTMAVSVSQHVDHFSLRVTLKLLQWKAVWQIIMSVVQCRTCSTQFFPPKQVQFLIKIDIIVFTHVIFGLFFLLFTVCLATVNVIVTPKVEVIKGETAKLPCSYTISAEASEIVVQWFIVSRWMTLYY